MEHKRLRTTAIMVLRFCIDNFFRNHLSSVLFLRFALTMMTSLLLIDLFFSLKSDQKLTFISSINVRFDIKSFFLSSLKCFLFLANVPL